MKLPGDPLARKLRICISHPWYDSASHSMFEREYDKVRFALDCQERFRWTDVSVTFSKGLKKPRGIGEIREFVEAHMSRADIVISCGLGVWSGGKKWLRRELTMVKRSFAVPKPLLFVKNWRAGTWPGWYASRADAWALNRPDSIVEGVLALRNLSPERRVELLSKGKGCPCHCSKPRLELNRLGGVYCGHCGRVHHVLSGGSRRWRDRARAYEAYDLWKPGPGRGV